MLKQKSKFTVLLVVILLVISTFSYATEGEEPVATPEETPVVTSEEGNPDATATSPGENARTDGDETDQQRRNTYGRKYSQW